MRIALTLLTLLAASLPAQAGKIDNGNWTHSCGPRPAVVNLDLKNPDAFNKSIGAVNGYRQTQRAWLECLQKEGNGDIQAINQAVSQYVNSEVAIAKEANEKFAADAKSAEAKFGDGK